MGEGQKEISAEMVLGEPDPDGITPFDRILARLICYIIGIEPVDKGDGSPNWWMFQDEAKKIIADLRKKYPIDRGKAR